MAGQTSTLGKLLVELFLKDDGFQSGLKRAEGSLKSSGTSMTQVSAKVSGAVVGAFKAMSLAAGAFGVAAIAVGAGFEQQMAVVSAITGKTGEALQPLVDTARELGRSTEFTAKQAGEGLESLARAGLSAEQSMIAAGDALRFAGVNGAELGDSAALIAASMKQFGLDASDSTRITDVFSKAMRSSLLDFTSIKEAMKFAGTAGAAFGMSLEETTAAVAAFRDLGLEGSLAGTQLRIALVKAAAGGAKAEAALSKYGVTLADINPETKTFAEIMQVVADKGITAGDSLQIFGARAGTNIAKLGESIRLGQTDLVAFTKDLENSAGETADMYEKMSQTVAFQGKVAISALQDLLIETFDTFAGPLKDLIKEVPNILNAASAALRQQSGFIGGQLKDTFGSLTKFLQNNAEELAQTFVNMIMLAVKLAGVLEPVIRAMLMLATHAEVLSVLLPTVFALAQIARFIPLVQGLATAFGLAQASVVAFGTTLTVTTGGLFALVAAIGIVVVGVTTYITKVKAASDETAKLRKAQQDLANLQGLVSTQQAAAADVSLKSQKARAVAILRSGEEINHSRRAELDAVLKLSGAEAVAAEQAGELVKTAEGFRRVSQLMNEGAEGAEKVRGAMQATRDAADEAAAASIRRGHQLALAQQERATIEKDVAERGHLTSVKLAKQTVDQKIAMLEREVSALDATAAQSKQTVKALAISQAKAVSDSAQKQRKAQLDADRDALTSAKATSEEKVAAIKSSVEEILKLLGRLDEEAATLRDDDFELAERKRLKEVAAVNATFDKAIAARRAAGHSAEQLEVEKQTALEQVRDNFIARETKEAKAAAKKNTDARANELERQQGILQGIRTAAMTDVERLVQEQAAVLADTGQLSAEERLEIWLEYQERIKQAVTDSLGEDEEKTKSFLGRLAESFSKAGKKIQQVWQAVTGTIKSVVGAVAGLIEQVSGFSFDLQSIIGDVQGAQQEARKAARDARKELVDAEKALGRAKTPEEAKKAQRQVDKAKKSVKSTQKEAARSPQDIAREMVNELVDNAIRFTSALAENLGPIIEELALRIPDLMTAIAGALPIIFEALAKGIPEILLAVVDNLGPIIRALVDGLADVVVAVIDAIPDIVESILQAIPSIIQRLVEAIPKIIVALYKMLPDLVAVLIEQIPAIIVALIMAIPRIQMAVIASIPEIVGGFIMAIPKLIGALFTGLLKAVFQLIPKSLRRLTKGFPKTVGKAIAEFVKGIPKFVGQLLGHIGKSVGGLITKIGKGIAEWIKKALKLFKVEKDPKDRRGVGKATGAISDSVKAVGKAIGGLFKKKGSGFSGVGYIPATMRMTVHKGERIVTADRNAVSSDETSPAPAGAGQNFPMLGGGGGGSMEVVVVAEGRVLEGAMVQSDARGHTSKRQKQMRRRAGVSIGMQRGRFKAWTG